MQDRERNGTVELADQTLDGEEQDDPTQDGGLEHGVFEGLAVEVAGLERGHDDDKALDLLETRDDPQCGCRVLNFFSRLCKVT